MEDASEDTVGNSGQTIEDEDLDEIMQARDSAMALVCQKVYNFILTLH